MKHAAQLQEQGTVLPVIWDIRSAICLPCLASNSWHWKAMRVRALVRVINRSSMPGFQTHCKRKESVVIVNINRYRMRKSLSNTFEISRHSEFIFSASSLPWKWLCILLKCLSCSFIAECLKSLCKKLGRSPLFALKLVTVLFGMLPFSSGLSIPLLSLFSSVALGSASTTGSDICNETENTVV